MDNIQMHSTRLKAQMFDGPSQLAETRLMQMMNAQDRTALRQYLEERFSQDELYELAFDMGVDSEKLSRVTKGEFSRQLILHFEDRGEIPALIAAALSRRPDETVAQIHEQISNTGLHKASTDNKTGQNRRVRMPFLLLVVGVGITLLVVLGTLVARRDGDVTHLQSQPALSATSGSLPASSNTATVSEVASGLPGTPLPLNAVISSGVDKRSKPRDVWQVKLESQKNYQIESQAPSPSSNGISVMVFGPGLQNIPDNADEADFLICDYSHACDKTFTAPLNGIYTIVVVARDVLENYTISVMQM